MLWIIFQPWKCHAGLVEAELHTDYGTAGKIPYCWISLCCLQPLEGSEELLWNSLCLYLSSEKNSLRLCWEENNLVGTPDAKLRCSVSSRDKVREMLFPLGGWWRNSVLCLLFFSLAVHSWDCPACKGVVRHNMFIIYSCRDRCWNFNSLFTAYINIWNTLHEAFPFFFFACRADIDFFF